MSVTPHPFVAQYLGGGFRRYEVRKGSVRSTQKSCYIVRKHQFLKCQIFIKKHKKRDIQSQTTLKKINFCFLGVGAFQHL